MLDTNEASVATLAMSDVLFNTYSMLPQHYQWFVDVVIVTITLRIFGISTKEIKKVMDIWWKNR